MKTARHLLLTLLLVLVLGTGSLHAGTPGVLFQYSTIQALMAGLYDGDLTFGELRRHGDFGIGTVNALDGEMVAVDGKFYQVKADGVAYPVPDSMKTPFADVMFFKPETTLTLTQPLDLRQLEEYVRKLLPTSNLIYAVKISGVFPYVKARSVPRQQRPYPPLVAAAKRQSVFEFRNAAGLMVGFWAPSYLKGVDVAGFHLHFLTADRRAGGHLLDCRIRSARVEICRAPDFFLKLPQTQEFYRKALEGGKESDIRQVER